MIVLRSSTRKANKNHQCDWCGCIIPKGNLYENQSCKGDDLYTWKNHIECSLIANKLNMFDDRHEGLTGNDFCEEIQEAFISIVAGHNDLYQNGFPDFETQLKLVQDYHLKEA